MYIQTRSSPRSFAPLAPITRSTGIIKYMINPVTTARMAPLGMDRFGSLRSPERPRPAITPVTTGKKIEKPYQKPISPVGADTGKGLPHALYIENTASDRMDMPTNTIIGICVRSAFLAPVKARRPTTMIMAKVTGCRGMCRAKRS